MFHWGGLMLSDPLTSESKILGVLPNRVAGQTVHASKLEGWQSLHRSPATAAYKSENNWTSGNSFKAGLTSHTIAGYAMDREHHLSSTPLTVATRYLECVETLKPELHRLMNSTDKQCAFAVSYHYDKMQGTTVIKSSAHTVGFFFSRGSFGARSVGCRFFDPNIGSWKFKTIDELLSFAFDDWLRNTSEGTVEGDPNESATKKLLKYYRLVLIVPD